MSTKQPRKGSIVFLLLGVVLAFIAASFLFFLLSGTEEKIVSKVRENIAADYRVNPENVTIDNVLCHATQNVRSGGCLTYQASVTIDDNGETIQFQVRFDDDAYLEVDASEQSTFPESRDGP